LKIAPERFPKRELLFSKKTWIFGGAHREEFGSNFLRWGKLISYH
jgi:hypothetical protein